MCVSPHGQLVVIGVPDHALRVYDVGRPGRAQPEPPPNVEQPRHAPPTVADQRERNALSLSEPPQALQAVSAEADRHGIRRLELIVEFYKLPRLQVSTPGESSEEEVEDYVRAPAVRQGELAPSHLGGGEIRCSSSDFQHSIPLLSFEIGSGWPDVTSGPILYHFPNKFKGLVRSETVSIW